MTPAVIAGVAAVLFLAAFGQALTGFGAALISVPLLSLLIGPVAAVVTVTMLSVFLSAGMAIQLRRSIDVSALRVVVPAGILGMPLGLLALRFVEPRWLSLGIGVVVLCFTLALIRGLTFSGRAATLTAGVASGVLLTSTGMNGPPLVIAFAGNRLPPDRFRATLQVVFWLHDLVAIGGFAIAGVLTPIAGWSLLIGLLPAGLGWWAGSRLVRRVDAVLFRRLVYGLLVATGLVSILTALLRG